MRHDAASIGTVLGGDFAPIESRRHDHVTPVSRTQHFQFSVFRRNSLDAIPSSGLKPN